MQFPTRRTAGAIILLFAIGTLTSCRFIKMAVAQMHSRDRFIPTQANADVRYAPGSQDMAERVAKAINHSREIVEQTHGAKFTHAQQVFVCRTDCFTTFVPGANAVASQFADSVFMNDDLLQKQEHQRSMPVENFLTHELAHLLLYQNAGPVAYLRVPSWFREGIAVAVSNGAGAEACTPTEAAQSILAGKSFDPSEVASLFRQKAAWNYGLLSPVFYRESEMFVQYLQKNNPIAFKQALQDVLDSQDFQESFGRAYGQSIASHWPGFVASLTQIVAQQ